MVLGSTNTKGKDGVTLSLFDVEPAEELFSMVNAREAAENLLGLKVEACSSYSSHFCAGVTTNPLVTAVSIAHSQHRPLYLSPDTIWLAILHGLSIHIEENWLSLRSQVTQSSSDRRYVEVSTDDFPIGSLESPWGSLVIEAASTAYGGAREEVADLFGVSFSTTTQSDRAAMDLAFLAAAKSHITLYDVVSVCGIPAITIGGRSEDWESIRSKVDQLEQFGLSWWTQHLRPICEEFVQVFRGTPNIGFWKEIHSVGPPICGIQDRLTGWIGHLFPYLTSNGKGVKPNPLFTKGEAPEIKQFPIGLRGIQLISRGGDSVNLSGGFIGIHQDCSDHTLTPMSGWAVTRQSTLDLLVERCIRSQAVKVELENGRERAELNVDDQKLARFYRRIRRLSTTGKGDFELLPVCEHLRVRESPPVTLLARLDEGRWLGALNVHTMSSMRAYLLNGTPVPPVFFEGDASTFETGGLGSIISQDFETVMAQILDCLEAERPITFVSLGRVDPQNRVAVEALLHRVK